MLVAALICTALALVSFIAVIVTGYTVGLVAMFLLVAVAAALLVIDISAKRHPAGRHAEPGDSVERGATG